MNERKRNQAKAPLLRLKGTKTVILKDENERFITRNAGNNNTANGRSDRLDPRFSSKKFPRRQQQTVGLLSFLLCYCSFNIKIVILFILHKHVTIIIEVCKYPITERNTLAEEEDTAVMTTPVFDVLLVDIKRSFIIDYRFIDVAYNGGHAKPS